MKALCWILAAAGMALLLWAYPRARDQEAVHWTMDRATVYSKATTAIRDVLRMEPRGWNWQSEFEIRQYLLLWQRKYGKGPGDFLGSALELKLEFDGGPRDVTVFLCANGRVCGIQQRRGGGRKRPPSPARPNEGAVMAERAFRLIAGDQVGRFRPSAASMDGDYRWEAPSDSSELLTWEIRVRTDSNGLRDARLRGNLPQALRNEFARAVQGTGETARIIGQVITGVGAVLVSSIFLFGSFRRRVDWKSAATGGVLFLATGLLPHATGTIVSAGDDWQIEINISLAAIAFAVTAAIAVGESWARDLDWSRWTTFRLFLQRKWFARSLGESVALGMAWSGVLAAIPLAVVVSGAFPSSLWSERNYLPALLANVPATHALHPWFDLLTFSLFVVMLPLLSARLGVRAVVVALFLPLASLQFGLFSPLITGLDGVVMTGLLSALAAAFLYWRSDLTAVLAAGKGSMLLTQALVLLNGPEHVRLHGWVMLGAFAGLFAVALVVMQTGRSLQPADPIGAQFLSERERLKAEFGLAQQAQQRLLPAEPPVIEGFSIAASCQPAREVGGDLYDYFQLADGRQGFCVADVSGKGMPAALYMTLTKGLLAAASPEARELQELARHVNQHLYTACKRKMFVTAVMASLEPRSRQVELLRAGHNSPLLYRAAARTAEYHKPAGIGMGLTSAALFSRGTKVQTLTLEPGDSLVLYSDGVTEAMNEKLELYGEERLKQIVEIAAGASAAQLLEEIRRDVSEFTGTEPAHDDITLLVVRAE